jgi:hypothetical protein
MAYLREEKESYEIDYPITQVWANISKAVKQLQWEIQKIDNTNHKATIKTKGAFLSYGSTLYIDAKEVNEKTTHMNINAETPVTTITSVADFGRTRDRLEVFIAELARLMNKK